MNWAGSDKNLNEINQTNNGLNQDRKLAIRTENLPVVRFESAVRFESGSN